MDPLHYYSLTDSFFQYLFETPHRDHRRSYSWDRESKHDGFVKGPSAALRFTFVAAAYLISTPHFSGFARLASGAFCAAIALATFYEIVKHCIMIQLAQIAWRGDRAIIAPDDRVVNGGTEETPAPSPGSMGKAERVMIEAHGLTKTYGSIRAVDGVSFQIPPGQVFGLLGPNGAGKTTTIKMLTTLSRPDSGKGWIDGLDVVQNPLAAKLRFGVVPQENNLDRELTAWENLWIYGRLHRMVGAKKEIETMLRTVDLWDRKDSVVGSFSTGMQRRLLLARALLPKPPVLFLDEPSIGLDPQIRRQMWDMIRKTKIEGRTVVLTTHYIEEAEALCDRVGILARGRLIALDTPQNLKAIVGEYIVEFINPEGKLIQSICRSPEEAHALAKTRENGVTIRKTNLEDVFIKLTGERIE